MGLPRLHVAPLDPGALRPALLRDVQRDAASDLLVDIAHLCGYAPAPPSRRSDSPNCPTAGSNVLHIVVHAELGGKGGQRGLGSAGSIEVEADSRSPRSDEDILR